MYGVGGGAIPVYVKITSQIIYIRESPDSIWAFLPDGRLVARASRYYPGLETPR